MATRKQTKSSLPPTLSLDCLGSAEEVAGLPGPGQWLVLSYIPTSLFSLKMSAATSTVGKTLLVPTPYAFKMALLDASLRHGFPRNPEELVPLLARAALRIGVPSAAVVTHTIVKVRQEPKDRKSGAPYIPAVAYREFVYYSGDLSFAFDLSTLDVSTASWIASVAPAVQYIGKRGGFLQYSHSLRLEQLSKRFTASVVSLAGELPRRVHLAWLDDFGPEAVFEALNSYSAAKIKREKHRGFVETVIPLGLVNTGPGFAHYQADPD
ncbi:MAG: hypothetical protein IANPNBLG_04792 [Bryobacteraceae bacterium]|nr:hypothetical protein [Bryobacteraceae bacterium]